MNKRMQGFSLIETLVAAALLLIIAVGILPLFARAMANNNAGNEYTKVSNFGKSRLEESFQLPFNGAGLMTVPIGQTASVTVEHYRADLGVWAPGAAPASALPPDPDYPLGNQVMWRRTTSVRQYSSDAIDDEDETAVELKKTDALDGGTDPIFIHLKEVEVLIESTRSGGALGAGKQVLLRTFKAK